MSNTANTSPFNTSSGYRSVLKNRNFLMLWLAQLFSQIADRVIFVVFVAVIAVSYGVSTSIQSWLYVAFTIPAILLTAAAGVFVDRWPKKNILIVTNLLRALFIALLPVFNKTLLGVYSLAFIVSSVTQFFVPAEASSIPTLVEERHLLAANSLFTTTMMGSIIIGFVLGDPLINIFGLHTVHVAISALFLLSAIFISFIKFKKSESKIEDSKNLFDFIAELKQGFAYIKENPIIFHAMLKLSALFSIIVMLSILSIGISQQALYPENPVLGAQKFVYIIAYSGIGMVIGSLMVGKLFRNVHKYKLIYTGFSLIGINLLLLTLVGLISQHLHVIISGWKFGNIHFDSFSLTFRMIYAYVIAFLIGIGSSLIAIPVQTVLHTSVPQDMRGKVFGVQFTMLSTSSTLPVIIAAIGADSIGVAKMLMIIGLPLAIFGISAYIKNRFHEN